MITICDPDFNVHQIAQSGQCFRVEKYDNRSYSFTAFDHNVIVEQNGNNITFHCSDDDYNNIWHNYFDLDFDYGFIKKQILNSRDDFLISAVKYGYGIRILKQDLWETIVSFIISQCNNIPRIKNTINRLCNGTLHFPSPREIAMLSFEQLRCYGLGYRVSYIKNLSENIVSGNIDINNLRIMTYDSAMEFLLKIYGIGYKVANCITLYGLHHLEAFPIDIWMKKIIKKYYNGNFDIGKFYYFAGVLQQYMFFYERSLSGKIY